MKKNILKYIVLVLAVSGTAVSCDKYLDRGPEENYSVEEAFKEIQYARGWLYNLYYGIPGMFDYHQNTNNNFVGGCDEMEITADYTLNQTFNIGAVSSASSLPYWQKAARYSRKIQLFFDNIDSTPMDNSERQEWIGEAHFLRALYNFWALEVHGPIPVYNKLFSPSQEFDDVERGTLDECVKFIVDDLDEAISLLPDTRIPTYYGRATSVAALALKSRVLLYVASPLFNGNADYASMLNSKGEPLIPTQYDASKWQKAADAAKACIDAAAAAGHELYYALSGDPYDSYRELFLKNWNKEILYARNVGGNSMFEQCCDPLSVNGYALYAPSQQMVDSYRMANGKDPFRTNDNGDVTYSNTGSPLVDADSGYEESGFTAAAGPYWPAGISNMFVNREPRFYASINFAGQTWKGRTLQLWNSGHDGFTGSGAGSYFTRTGYILKKLADETASPSGWTTPQVNQRSWPLFRLAEIYLNYAEALNEAKGPSEPDVLKYLNEVRKRGGIPALTGSFTKEEMRKLIHQERHVELAFESHRFFDTRRWKTAALTENVPLYGLNIKAGTSVSDPAFYKRTVWEKRVFNAPANYLFPIPQSDIDKCKSLKQNIGY
jgi:hypothetical protein